MSKFSVDHDKLEVPQPGQQTFSANYSNNKNVGHPEAWDRNNGSVSVNVPGWWQRMIWAPYADSRQWRAGPYFRSLFMELLGSVLLAWIVSTAASVATSGSVGVNALTIGFAHAIFILIAYSWRHTTFLPRHLNPAMTIAEMLHQRVGLVVAIPYLAVQVAGSFLAAPILNATGGSAIPNYAAALRPVSFAGAFLLEIFLSMIPVFVYLHNMPIDLHAYRLYEESSSKVIHLHRIAKQVAGAIFVATFLGLPNGLYSLNWVNYLGPAVYGGGFSLPTSASWTIYVFAPLIGGVVGWVVHLLSWNMNGLSRSELTKYVNSERAGQALAFSKIQTFIASAGKV